MTEKTLSELEFTDLGLLSVGDYHGNLSDIRASLLVHGPDNRPDWDATWRAHLVDNLGILANQLWQVGIQRVVIDGSFVEDKAHPNDIDGYFACSKDEIRSGALADALNRLDPFKVWTWDFAARRPYRANPKPQLPMWHHYRVELHPHFGQGVGMVDDFGQDMEFPSFFRQQRITQTPKGVVILNPG